jgi:hypothetical protein
MSNKRNTILWSLTIYGAGAVVVYLLGRLQREGIISMAGVFFIFEWLVMAVIGIIALILRKANVLKRTNFFYTFLGVSNLCNALVIAFVIWMGGERDFMTSTWLRAGATMCLGVLMVVDN